MLVLRSAALFSMLPSANAKRQADGQFVRASEFSGGHSEWRQESRRFFLAEFKLMSWGWLQLRGGPLGMENFQILKIQSDDECSRVLHQYHYAPIIQKKTTLTETFSV